MSATTVTFEPAHRSSPPPGRLRRLVRGPAADPQWARPALFGLLALTALLYLWDLSRNGYANDFYAAAVQAGTKSWKAAFFGSFDSSNFITVDKTPASLWVDELSAKIFGFNSWSLLAPQAVEGVASVALLYAAVRRWFGPSAGLIAGAVLALTPAAALIFRFNNPDALLVLLMTAAGYAVQRALERDRTRWLVFAGLLLGFAFLTKMAQAFLVLPGFGIAYLWAGPARLGRRIWQLLAGLGGVIVGAGWWIAIAQLTPAADRPYFGGSTDNNILELALGYNGLGRLDGSETGSIGGGGGGGSSFGGATGVFRLFQSEFGGQVSWLIPAALISLGALLWISQAGAAHLPGSRVRPPVGRVAAGYRGGLQLHAGHHPPLLHGRAGAGDRRAGRRRRHLAPAVRVVRRWAGRSPRSACSSPGSGRTSCSSGRPSGCRGCGGPCCWRACSARSRSSPCPSCSARTGRGTG